MMTSSTTTLTTTTPTQKPFKETPSQKHYFTTISSSDTSSALNITVLGLLANLILSLTKYIGGRIFNSQALRTDAAHSASDMLVDVVTLASIYLSSQPLWKSTPQEIKSPGLFVKGGHGDTIGRGNGIPGWEVLGALLINSIVLFSGVELFKSGVASLLPVIMPFGVQLGDHHSHHSHNIAVLPDKHAAWFAVTGILVKEGLYRASTPPMPLLFWSPIFLPYSLPPSSISKTAVLIAFSSGSSHALTFHLPSVVIVYCPHIRGTTPPHRRSHTSHFPYHNCGSPYRPLSSMAGPRWLVSDFGDGD